MNLLNILKKTAIVAFMLPIAAFATASVNSSLIAKEEKGGAHHGGEHHAAGEHHEGRAGEHHGDEARHAGEYNNLHRGMNGVNGVNVNGGGAGVVNPTVIETPPTVVVPPASGN